MSTTLRCVRCGKEFKVFPSSTRGIKCCSRECRIQSVEERFWNHVDKKSDSECWEWMGAKLRHGYGSFGVSKKKSTQAHRFSWYLTNGEIPDGIYVCHKCDNPPCCNPKHLFLGTAKDNADDMRAKGRYWRDKRNENENTNNI